MPRIVAVLLAVASSARVVRAEDLPTKPVLTLAAAVRVAAAQAQAEAARRAKPVVDDGGNLLVLHFRRPSREFEEQVKNGRVAAPGLPGARPLQGGLPLVVGGRCVGAIGVSGDTPQVDEDGAQAGAAAL